MTIDLLILTKILLFVTITFQLYVLVYLNPIVKAGPFDTTPTRVAMFTVFEVMLVLLMTEAIVLK